MASSKLLVVSLLYLLLAGPLVALVATSSPGVSSVEVREVTLGVLKDGSFYPRPDRTFRVGEVLAVEAKVVVSGSPGTRYQLDLGLQVLDPLGAVLVDRASSKQSRLVGGYEEWVFTFAFNVTPDMITGYYTLEVSAYAGGVQSLRKLDFFIEAYASRRNMYEVVYSVELTGNGRIEELYLSLPANTSTTAVVAGPLITPAPLSYYRDAFGNIYAVYKGLEVGSRPLKIAVKFAVVETARHVTEDAPMSSLANLPEALKVFLKPEKYIESNSPEIRALASKLTSGSQTVLEAVKKIADYTSTTIAYNPALGTISASWELGALWTLHSRQGVCLQYARLFVALARASGIPARVAGGLLATPPSAEGREYLHAWAEVYIPGYGWLPVEPQRPGFRVGVDPPGPGYIRLVAGLGEGFESRPVVFVYYKYTGSVEARQSYSYKQTPLESITGRVPLRLRYKPLAYFQDNVAITVDTQPGTVCEVIVLRPDKVQYTLTLRCPCTLELKANKTGVWVVEFFASNPNSIPSYARINFTVAPRPLSLEIEPREVLLFENATIRVKTSPPAPGVNITVDYEDCLTRRTFTLQTREDGVASFHVTPLFLCKIRILAEASSEGYEHARAALEITPQVPAEATTATVLLVVALVVSFSLRRRAKKSL
ncbi:transglutaminase domain-containing protein [Infirmifilum lucidum]|uniref:Transglutaminase domain-containing protein n=1 Tax=Infirmifilum lucidum TaxID=2776706 RepID=A0A7L9FHB0_9CREN|nr:transglutaminase domain-containing protein [Infirmifilum lucidum]QOJ79159.1 transglutaminase domain-containing protein [Infirmifilum lucidum]